MKENSYFVFEIDQHLFGVSTHYIQEVLPLSELASLPEVAHDVVSEINFRGNTLLVIDINLSLGDQPISYSLTDSLVVLGWETLQIGFIVNEVRDVIDVSPEELIIEFSQEQGFSKPEQNALIAGIVQQQQDILILNPPEQWLRHPTVQQLISVSRAASQPPLVAAAVQTEVEHPEFDRTAAEFLDLPEPQPDLMSAQAAVIQTDDSLQQFSDSQSLGGSKSLTIVSLADTLLGIDLQAVQEFTDLRQVTPIPCCPSYIAGNMNFRGKILTLVDVRRLLNLPSGHLSGSAKVLVLDVEGIVFGLIVEEILDVMFFLYPNEISSVPTDSYPLNSQYLQGVALYHEQAMNILDLSRFLLNSGLIVDETV